MKEIEERSLQFDLTYQRLMENAGSAAAAFIRRTFNILGLNVMIFCGKGNNGGDGFVVARKLFESGANVLIILVEGEPAGPGASAMLDTARALELPVADFDLNHGQVLEVLAKADIIVDAMYGTGFHGRLNDSVRAACAAVNAAIAAVVALDVPSGVACDTGHADADAVRADFTVAFDSLKPLHILPAGQEFRGVVEVLDIGVPDEAREGISSRFGVLTTDMVFEHLPPRTPDAHKGTFGTLLTVCGSSRYRGAAILSAMGALRSGVGIVTVASTEAVCFAVSLRMPEATLLPLEEDLSGSIEGLPAREALRDALKKATAVLVGCGLSQGPHAAEIVSFLLGSARCPVIVDADGINALSGNIHVLRDAKCPVILTPHPGEMSRLCGKPVDAIEADRAGVAMEFARRHGVVVLLKGRETVIADPEGGLIINQTGNAGLAKGGSGDVLAGMIGAFLAQGVPPVYAAACAAHLHGLAADRTALRKSQYAMLPSELLDDLALIFAERGR